jgi:uncharacterized protein (DUF2147 family)
MTRIAACLLFFALAALPAMAQYSPIGVWKTIDDKTGEAKSHIEIFEQDGRLHGKIVRLLRKGPDTRCENCPGAKKNQLLIGMLVVENLRPEEGHWKNGSIMDPESGNVYNCAMWFERGKPDELKVRGRHWTGIYRTQTWYRVK